MMKKIMSMVLVALLVFALSACGGKADDKPDENVFETAKVGDIVNFGVYEQDNDEANGKEKIEWRVLAKDDEKVLLISEKVIDCIPFNDEMKDEVAWEDSSIRKWLDEDFIATAFTEDEAGKILETSNENDEVRDYGVPAKENTTDRVFLLSIKETTEYFESNENAAVANDACIAYPTEYAKAKGIEVRNGGAVMWWLRESTAQQDGAACDDFGKRFNRGRDMDYPSTGVRPAMWVKIDTK